MEAISVRALEEKLGDPQKNVAVAVLSVLGRIATDGEFIDHWI